MSRSKLVALALPLTILLAAWALPTEAQNLLTNPDFDTDLSGWTFFPDPSTHTFDWRSRDADDSPTSGSIRFEMFDERRAFFGYGSQCAPISAGTEYVIEADTRLGGATVGDGAAGLSIFWYGEPGCRSLMSTTALVQDNTLGVWVHQRQTSTAPAGAMSAGLNLWTGRRTEGPETVVTFFDNVYFAPTSGPGAACVPAVDTLCIDDTAGDRRFKAEVSYDTAVGGGSMGDGKAIPLETLDVTQGGLIWFFNKRNPEMLVKVLNGCGTNGHYWVFYAAVTNIAFEIEVTDTLTGTVWTRSNPDRNPAEPQQDTFAFPCS